MELVAKSGKLEDLRDLVGQDFQGSLLPSSVFCFDKTYQHVSIPPLLSSAGFWSEADVTRPFVSQGVITDGKYFSFFCYQLNTLALTVQADQNNPRKNICWGTHSKPLYETVEDNDVKGFDDDVLLQIVDFLLNKPTEDRTQLSGSQEKGLDLGP